MRIQRVLGSDSNNRPNPLVRGWVAALLTMLILGVCAGEISTASGQGKAGYNIPPPPPRPSACQPVSVTIRNLRYDDYSRYTRLSTTSINAGGYFQIRSNCLQYNGPVVVTLQDVSRGSGPGVTAFRLTNVSVNGSVLTAQGPTLSLFRNRTYHVAVFVYGQRPWKTANPGQITIR